MFSDGVINLVERGVVTNARKVIQTGKVLGGFAFGTKALYDFMDNNPFVGQSASDHYIPVPILLLVVVLVLLTLLLMH